MMLYSIYYLKPHYIVGLYLYFVYLPSSLLYYTVFFTCSRCMLLYLLAARNILYILPHFAFCWCGLFLCRFIIILLSFPFVPVVMAVYIFMLRRIILYGCFLGYA